jgi:plastocyanin
MEENNLRKFYTIIFSIGFLTFLYLPGQVIAGNIKGALKVKGLRTPENILVYLSKAPPAAEDLSKAKFVMDQRNLEFVPQVLPILVGATVDFPNNDKVDHNVFSMSRTKKFNLGSYTAGESKSVVFDKPGIVELRCDVHAEMAAYILVMKNPYFAVTDKQGQFEIPDSSHLEQTGLTGVKDLAPGKYFIKSWHQKLKSQKQAVVVPENGVVTIQLDLTRGTPGVLYK